MLIKVTSQGEIVLTIPALPAVVVEAMINDILPFFGVITIDTAVEISAKIRNTIGMYNNNITLSEADAQKMSGELIKACEDSKQVNKLLKQIQGVTKDYNCAGKVIISPPPIKVLEDDFEGVSKEDCQPALKK